MAIRQQKGRKRSFFVYWTNPFTSKRESKSCQTREEAEKLEAYVKYQLIYEREAFRRKESCAVPVTKTLETILYLYLKERNLALQNLEKTLFAVKTILSEYGDTDIEQVNAALLAEIKERLSVRGNKGTTVRRKMGILRAALHWAHRRGFIESIPLFPVMPPVQYTRYVPPTQEEVSLLYAVSPTHLRRVLILGFQLGMRVGQSELLRLRWQDVDLRGAVVRVPNADKGAMEPWREVPIRQDLLPLMESWSRADSEVGQEYLVSYKGKAVRSIKTAWEKALARAGINRHIRPYDLRHGFATEAVAAGVDYGTVAALMGHKSPVMVLKHYQHVKNSQKLAAVEALPAPPQCVQNDVCKN